jgi:hypothetical protein
MLQSIMIKRKAKQKKRIRKKPWINTNPLLKLVGFEVSKTGKVGLNVDEIYLPTDTEKSQI